MAGATYRHWRIYVTAVDGSSTFVSIGEVELFGSVGGADLTTGRGGFTSQSGDGAVGGASSAIDDSTGSEAGSSFPLPYWWKIDLGAPTYVDHITIAAQRVVPNRTPSVFIVQGSDDNSTWTDVTAFGPSTGWAEFEERTFTLDVATFVVAGLVKDATGAPAARTVRVNLRSTGELLAEATSDATTGAFSFNLPSDAQVTVVCLNESGGTENALVLDRIVPVSAGPTDPDFASVVLLLHLNTDFSDSSPIARTATTVNNVSIVSAAGQAGGAAAQSTTTPGQLLYASSTDFATAGPWTIEWAMTCTAFNDAYFMAASAVRYMQLDSAGNLSPVNWGIGGASLTLNTRHRIAISRESGGTTRMFVDGALVGTGSISASADAAPLDLFGVPGRPDLPSFRGLIDEFRFTRTCRYTAAYTPAADEFPNA